MTLTLAVLVAGWILGWFAFGRPRTVPAPPEPAGATPAAGVGAAVIIPARDEAAGIAELLAGLAPALSGPGGPTRIVVVDDHSDDDTAAIARSFAGVEVVPAPDLPAGWAGKNWACHTGVEHVRSAGAGPDLQLCFLDADVRLGHQALERVLAEHTEVGGLLSVQPWHDTRRWWEQPSAVFNLVAAMGVGLGGRKTPTGAFGPVLVTMLGDYDRVGGHGSVRAEVAEDLALAGRYRSRGLGPSVYIGDPSIRFRMYPAGLGQVIEGWSKNFATGAGSTPPPRMAAIVAWISALGTAGTGLAAASLTGGSLLIPAAAYAAFAAQFALMTRRLGRFHPTTPLLFPLLLAFFVGIFVRSGWLTWVRRQVVWRGRAIPTATSGT